MTEQDDMFTMPADAQSGLSIGDLEGHLVIMRAIGDEKTIDTKIGESSYVPAEVLDLDSEDPTHWQELWVFSAGVKSQLAAATRQGKPIVGTIGKGVAKPGKSAPWLVLDPDAKQVDKARKAFVTANAPF
jgi:hypothetical protein